MTRIGNHPSAHLFSVEVELSGTRSTIEVHANTRAQAGSVARLAGYTVYSVNLVG